MKTRISAGWIFGMALTVATVAPGFAQERLSPPPTTIPPDQAGTPAASKDASVASRPAPAVSAVPSKGGAESPSPKTPLSNWSSEIQKLTQAGVDERVILSYIANSAGIFNLSPDHIIFLKNVGVSPKVITEMIQHDQVLMPGARPVSAGAIPPVIPAALSPAPGASQFPQNEDCLLSEPWFPEDEFNAPEQPDSAGPVRVPYTVKLNDPIVILKLPSFALPYW